MHFIEYNHMTDHSLTFICIGYSYLSSILPKNTSWSSIDYLLLSHSPLLPLCHSLLLHVTDLKCLSFVIEHCMKWTRWKLKFELQISLHCLSWMKADGDIVGEMQIISLHVTEEQPGFFWTVVASTYSQTVYWKWPKRFFFVVLLSF